MKQYNTIGFPGFLYLLNAISMIKSLYHLNTVFRGFTYPFVSVCAYGNFLIPAFLIEGQRTPLQRKEKTINA